MTFEEKVDKIMAHTVIYAILFRNAGVGFQFYEGEDGTFDRSLLRVYAYKDTLEEAVDFEMKRLKLNEN